MIYGALALGLLGSLHCLGMCGPIAFMLPLSHQNVSKKTFEITLYHLGRISAYALLGLAFGLVGKGLGLFGLQQQISIAVGVLMIVVVLLPKWFNLGINLQNPWSKAIQKVKSNLAQHLKEKRADTFLSIGFLNGLLPCGLVYMALVGAIAMGNALEGAFYMALFGLGTVPLMTIAAFSFSKLQMVQKQRVKKLIPIAVVLLGLLFVLRGLGLGIPYVSPKAPATTEVVSSEMECH